MSCKKNLEQTNNPTKDSDRIVIKFALPVKRSSNNDHNGEIQVTDALNAQAKNDRVIAFKFKGKRFDCGGIQGHLDANNYLAKKYIYKY